MSNVQFTSYSDLNKVRLINYLDQNRKYNVALDPLKLRTYDKDWAADEAKEILLKITNNIGEILFISVRNNIIGFVYYYIEDHKNKVIHLSKLFIEEEFREKGYAKKALWMLEARLKEKGFKYISLNVFSPNETATSLYRKIGFADRFNFMIKEL